MDDLNKKGYDSENGTPYVKAGVNRLEKGYDSEKGTPYEQAGADPFGDNDFSSADVSTQNDFGSFPESDHFDNIGQHETENGMPKKQYRNEGLFRENSPEQSGMNGYYGQLYADSPYGEAALQPYPQKNSGLAIAAFVISLVNLLFLRSVLSFLTVPLCLILAIVSLAGKRSGKGWAIASIVVSSVSAFLFCTAAAVVVRIYPDFRYFADNHRQIIEDYERDGTIPERFSKYDRPSFSKYWKSMGFDDFGEFFGWFIHQYDFGDSSYGSSETEATTKHDYPIDA